MLEMTPEIVNRLADGLIEKGAALGGQADELFASRCRVLDLLYQLERRPGQFAQEVRHARIADFEPGREPLFDQLAAQPPILVAARMDQPEDRALLARYAPLAHHRLDVDPDPVVHRIVERQEIPEA